MVTWFVVPLFRIAYHVLYPINDTEEDLVTGVRI